MIRAADVMSRKVMTLPPTMPPKDAARRLARKRLQAAPVVDEEGRFLGVFTQGNCMSALVDAIHDAMPGTEVRFYMNQNAPTVTEDTDLLTIVEFLRDPHHDLLPVLRDGRVIGQVNRSTVILAVIRQIAPSPTREAQLLYLSALRGYEDPGIDQAGQRR